jgi:hypothetical protein
VSSITIDILEFNFTLSIVNLRTRPPCPLLSTVPADPDSFKDHTNRVVAVVENLTSQCNNRWFKLNKRTWNQGEVTVFEYIRITILPQTYDVIVRETRYFVKLGDSVIPSHFHHSTLHRLRRSVRPLTTKRIERFENNKEGHILWAPCHQSWVNTYLIFFDDEEDSSDEDTDHEENNNDL